jgi:type I restriction enzyme R subunit
LPSSGSGGTGDTATDPTKPSEELLEELDEAIGLVRGFLTERGAPLEEILEKTGFERNASILAAKEAANENDESRKRFEMMCREVFRKFRACINVPGLNARRRSRDANSIIYKSLQDDRDQADITDIIRQLHAVVDEAITPQTSPGGDTTTYDISKIDFDLLRREFQRTPAPKTTVQNLRQAVENRLQRLLRQNPMRTDFQKHYEEIVGQYNQEKDRLTIEKTFEALLQFVKGLDQESSRAIREGLDEESLAIFDLLTKPELTPEQIRRVKKVAARYAGDETRD